MVSYFISTNLTLPMDFKPFGLFFFFVFCTTLIYFCSSGYFIYRLLHPKRKGFGAALGHGLPTTPDEACQLHQLTDPDLQASNKPECEYQAYIFTFHDGLESPGWIIEGDRPDAPILIMNHGWGSSKYGLLKLMPFFKPLTSQIIIHDQRGHGEAGVKTGSKFQGGRAQSYTFTIDEWQDVISVSREVQSIFGDHPQVLYGASMGAALSIHAAAAWQTDQDAPPLAGLILESPSRLLLEPPARQLKAMRIWPAPIMFATQTFFKYRFGQRFHQARDSAKRIDQIQAPILIMHGSDDWLCPLDSAESLAQNAQTCTLRIFEMHEHLRLAWSQGEASKNQYAKYLFAYFQDLSLDQEIDSA